MAQSLAGTKSEQNLKSAFAGESQANRRYLYYARVADIEGYPDIGGLFRGRDRPRLWPPRLSKRSRRSRHGCAFRHTEKNLKSAIGGETYEYTEMQDRKTVIFQIQEMLRAEKITTSIRSKKRSKCTTA